MKDGIKKVFYLTKAIEIRPDDGFAHWGRVTIKNCCRGIEEERILTIKEQFL